MLEKLTCAEATTAQFLEGFLLPRPLDSSTIWVHVGARLQVLYTSYLCKK